MYQCRLMFLVFCLHHVSCDVRCLVAVKSTRGSNTKSIRSVQWSHPHVWGSELSVLDTKFLQLVLHLVAIVQSCTEKHVHSLTSSVQLRVCLVHSFIFHSCSHHLDLLGVASILFRSSCFPYFQHLFVWLEDWIFLHNFGQLCLLDNYSPFDIWCQVSIW